MSRRPLVLVLGLVLGFTGCSDDEPVPGPWTAQNLPGGSQGVSLWDIASDGDRVVAVGGQQFSLTNVLPVILYDATGSGNFSAAVPGSAPATALLTGVTFASDSLIAVGTVFDPFGDPGGAVVLDQRGGWSTHLPATGGGATCVASDGAGTLWAGGLAGGGLSLVSTAPDSWVFNGIFGTLEEARVTAIASNGSDFFICGWNDAGPPATANFLAHRGSVGWETIPGGPIDSTDTAEYRALYVSGGIPYLGGATDLDGTPSAFLVSYSDLGGWTQIAIPSGLAEDMESINDMLRLPSGDWILACGESRASLWYWTQAEAMWTNEGPNLPGAMTALTRTSSGAVYAVGWTADSPSLSPDPLLYRRN